jgi:hypothetical protein
LLLTIKLREPNLSGAELDALGFVINVLQYRVWAAPVFLHPLPNVWFVKSEFTIWQLDVWNLLVAGEALQARRDHAQQFCCFTVGQQFLARPSHFGDDIAVDQHTG